MTGPGASRSSAVAKPEQEAPADALGSEWIIGTKVRSWGKAPAMTLYDVRDNRVTADILRPPEMGSYHGPVNHHSIARTATRYIKSSKSKPVLKPLIGRSTAVPAAPRFHLAKASSSSSIFCFAQAAAFSVGDDRILNRRIKAGWQWRQSARWIVGSAPVGQRHSRKRPDASLDARSR